MADNVLSWYMLGDVQESLSTGIPLSFLGKLPSCWGSCHCRCVSAHSGTSLTISLLHRLIPHLHLTFASLLWTCWELTGLWLTFMTIFRPDLYPCIAKSPQVRAQPWLLAVPLSSWLAGPRQATCPHHSQPFLSNGFPSGQWQVLLFSDLVIQKSMLIPAKYFGRNLLYGTIFKMPYIKRWLWRQHGISRFGSCSTQLCLQINSCSMQWF